jgi:hypothetical protein
MACAATVCVWAFHKLDAGSFRLVIIGICVLLIWRWSIAQKEWKFSPTFKDRCRDRILTVFSALHLQAPSFEQRYGTGSLAGDFEIGGTPHEIEIYGEGVVMHSGRHAYECYMPKELRSEEALIEAFAGRLTRLLSGGTWEEPSEQPWWLGRIRALAERIRRSLRPMVR